MKPFSRHISTLALSVTAILCNQTAFAATFTTTDGLLTPYNFFGGSAFVFQNSKLDAITPPPLPDFGVPPGFAVLYTLLNDVNDSPSSLYQHGFQSYIDENNSVFFNPGAPIESYAYYLEDGETGYGYHYRQPVYDAEGHVTIVSDFLTTSTYKKQGEAYTKITYAWDEYNGGLYSKLGEYYRWEAPDSYRYEQTVNDKFTTSDDPFSISGVMERMNFDLPVSGYGIFDFEKTLVFYEGEVAGIALSEILAGNIDGERLVYLLTTHSFLEDRNITMIWESNRKITGITLAYSEISGSSTPSIPEPETWAMLLAGLGIVGAVTRRRRIKAAM